MEFKRLKNFIFAAVLVFSQTAFAQVPVIITCGQSNADGRVPTSELPAYMSFSYGKWNYFDGRSSNYSAGTFSTIAPHAYGDNGAVTTNCAFDAVTYSYLERALQSDFYVVKLTQGGTSIDPASSCVDKSMDGHWSADADWLSGTNSTIEGGKSFVKSLQTQFHDCLTTTFSKLAQGYDVKAILWHQGCQDNNDSGAISRYEANLKTMIAWMRHMIATETGNSDYENLPFILGTVPEVSASYNATINAAHRKAAADDANTYCIDLSTLGLRDSYHFNARSAEVAGIKYYKQLCALGVCNDVIPDWNWQATPFTGVAPNNLVSGQKYFIYNVESGLFLDLDHRKVNNASFYAQLGFVGHPLTFNQSGGGWLLNAGYGKTSMSINGANPSFNNAASTVIFTIEARTVNGVPNAVKIYNGSNYLDADVYTPGSPAKNIWNLTETSPAYYINSAGTKKGIWQIVTAAERNAYLRKASASNTLDATFNFRNYHFTQYGTELDGWTINSDFVKGNASDDGGYGYGEGSGNRFMYIDNRHFDFQQTITGLPNGTYRLEVQGFYRDGAANQAGAKRDASTEVLRGKYSINEVEATLMSIADDRYAKKASVTGTYNTPSGTYYVPGGQSETNKVFNTEGAYINNAIQCTVTDGTLTIRFWKTDSPSDGCDRVAINGIKVTYLGTGDIVLSDNVSNEGLTQCVADHVTLNRSIDADKWSTFCVPFSMSAADITSQLGADAEVKELTGLNATADNYFLTFSDATRIDAGKPYVVRLASPVTQISLGETAIRPTLHPVTVTDPDNGEEITFSGSFSPVAEVPMGSFILSDNKFYHVNSEVSMNAFRAYFLPSESSSTRSMYFSWDESIVTGITEVQEASPRSSAPVYDIMGRRVDSSLSKKGLYIKDGKKYIVR